jgi:uncharacterized protein YecE (DUF72 family)
VADKFSHDGSGLERYASVFNGVEVNSTFYRTHRNATLLGWSASVPAEFRFSFKMPRVITHDERLQGDGARLKEFVRQVAMVGDRLGPLLVQLPPTLEYDPEVAARFFEMLRSNFAGEIAIEPRHITWLKAHDLFHRYDVVQVIADPPVITGDFRSAVSGRFGYLRLHGAPRTYYSRYDDDFIAGLAKSILASQAELIWCVFDNTASGAAIQNALSLETKISATPISL